jgi:hypothetical protein
MFRQSISGQSSGARSPSFTAAFADDEQCMFRWVQRLFVFPEGLQIQIRRESFDADDVVQNVLL